MTKKMVEEFCYSLFRVCTQKVIECVGELYSFRLNYVFELTTVSLYIHGMLALGGVYTINNYKFLLS